MKKNLLNNRFLVAPLLVAAVMTAVNAQGVPSAPYLSVPQKCAFLISNPYVAKELHFTAQQSQTINEAFKRHDVVTEKLAKLKEPPEKEIAANDIKLANAYLSALNPTQMDVILRLGIRQIGSEALLDPNIAAKLGLSDSQANKIGKIYRAFEKRSEDVDAMEGDALAAVPEPKPGADRKAYDKSRSEVFASYQGERNRVEREKLAADKEILDVMTPAQRAAWLKLSAVPPKKRK